MAGGRSSKSFPFSKINLALPLPLLPRAAESRREVTMQKAIRIAVLSAAVAGGLLFLAPASAEAQVRVRGRFPLPHGSISVRVGDPYYRGGYYGGGYYGYSRYPVGSYVPYGYRVIRRPRLGYGFYSPVFVCRAHGLRHAHWVPVRSHRRRYIVVERPVVVVERRVNDRYGDDRYGDDRYGDDRYYRDDSRCQDDGAYCGDPNYDFNRELWDRNYHPYDR